MRYCLRLHHDNDVWIQCYDSKKKRVAAYRKANKSGFYAEYLKGYSK